MSRFKNICYFFNYASHYREEIYLKMEEELGGDFYFGDIENDRMEKINYALFSGKIQELHTYRLFSDFVWVRRGWQLVFKPYNIYIVTGEYYNITTWLILLLNRMLGKKTFLWTHGWYGNETRIKKAVKKVYHWLATGILLYGDYARRLMISEGFDPKRLQVIYNSLSYERQLGIREKLTNTSVFYSIFGNSHPVIIFTGRLTPVKKLDQLLKAQEALMNKGVSINVFILGDGTEKANLEGLCKTYGVSGFVHFYGACYDEQKIAEFYYNADCCVSPGNVGLTGIHAMSYGCPVISHNNFSEQMPEFEVIQEGQTGLFFKQNDVEDLSVKIQTILCMNRNTLRDNCFKVIDHHYNTRFQIKLLHKILSTI